MNVYAGGVQVDGPYCWFTESVTGAQALGRPAQDFQGWAQWRGTSFAAATVTGCIAREMSGGLSAVEAAAQVLGPSEPWIVDPWSGDGVPRVLGAEQVHEGGRRGRVGPRRRSLSASR